MLGEQVPTERQCRTIFPICSTDNLILIMSEFEDKHVRSVYEEIAKDFDRTRWRVWPSVAQIIDETPENSTVLEVGCGNGKNLKYAKELDRNLQLFACDNCKQFVEMCRTFTDNVCLADQRELPYKDGSFDCVLSIAVLHHLKTLESRQKVIDEIVRVLAVGGRAMIEVWAMKQPENSKRKFVEQDNMVPWKFRDKVYHRFYHVFVENELEALLEKYQDINIIKSEYEFGNYLVVISKTE